MRIVILAAALLLAPALAGAEVIDRVVVVVGDQLVLASDIRLEAELSFLDESPLPFWDPGHDDPLHRLVDAAVIRSSAGELALYEPPADAVRQRLEALRLKFRDRASWEEFLGRWGLDEPALLGVLRRRMVVERFLFRNLQLPPDDRVAWLAAADQLLTQLRERYRVREIPQRGFP